FQRAGFAEDRLVEIHGAIEWLQCLRRCGAPWPAGALRVEVDADSGRARPPLPSCPRCGALARPNILMFGGGDWDGARTARQSARLDAWLAGLAGGRLLVVECGAGTAVPTVRWFSERLVARRGAALVRLNLRDAEVPAGQVGLALGACQGLLALERRLEL